MHVSRDNGVYNSETKAGRDCLRDVLQLKAHLEQTGRPYNFIEQDLSQSEVSLLYLLLIILSQIAETKH